MSWYELLPPVKEAVCELLIRLDGASQYKKKSANCFLLYGSRGTGKTTVMLSARHAVKYPVKFFERLPDRDEQQPIGDQHGNEDAKQREATRESASNLHKAHACWLDMLDLEPLPSMSNLLTTLLTRVQGALELHPNGRRRPKPPRSPFEEGADSARELLSRLISDATLMWQDIEESDTRDRANREVAAASIYAEFQASFKEAMKKLAEELAQRSGQDRAPPIILPIDNVDRSANHAHSMVKLAQMVSCEHLWLVLVADHADIFTLLERAYWKELIRTGEGPGLSGKPSVDGEDEAFIMARRQAAAALQKILPPSHRVRVRTVRPYDTLNYKPLAADATTPRESIGELLEQLAIPTFVRPHQDSASDLNLFDLMDARKLINNSLTGEHTDRRCLTLAGQQALTLPARSVLDLWQLANRLVHIRPKLSDRQSQESDDKRAVNEKPDHADLRAESLVRSMLRHAVEGSRMSSKTSECIQERIITRDIDGGTVLDFADLKLSPKRLYVHDFSLSFNFAKPDTSAATDPTYYTRSKLSVAHVENFVLYLEIGHKAANSVRYAHENSASERSEDARLPPYVSAWLILLCDILTLADRPAIIGLAPILDSGLIEARHDTVTLSSDRPTSRYLYHVRWPEPIWDTFLGFELFQQHWERYKSCLDLDRDPKDPDDTALLRQLAAGWVACVLRTFVSLAPNAQKFRGELAPWLNPQRKDHRSGQQVMAAAAFLREYIRKEGLDRGLQRDTGKHHTTPEREWAMRFLNWIENCLPLLASELLVPKIQAIAPRIDESSFLSSDQLEPATHMLSILRTEQSGQDITHIRTEIQHHLLHHVDDADGKAGNIDYTQNLLKHWRDNWPALLAEVRAEGGKKHLAAIVDSETLDLTPLSQILRPLLASEISEKSNKP